MDKNKKWWSGAMETYLDGVKIVLDNGPILSMRVDIIKDGDDMGDIFLSATTKARIVLMDENFSTEEYTMKSKKWYGDQFRVIDEEGATIITADTKFDKKYNYETEITKIQADLDEKKFEELSIYVAFVCYYYILNYSIM